jgi:hypothetical protein
LSAENLSSSSIKLTEVEVAVVVGDALGEVDIAGLAVTVLVEESSTEDGDGTITLDGEVDVLGGAREAGALPEEVALEQVSN